MPVPGHMTALGEKLRNLPLEDIIGLTGATLKQGLDHWLTEHRLYFS